MSLLNPTEFVASLVEDKCDPLLGGKVREHLTALGLETQITEDYNPSAAFTALDNGIYGAYKFLGLDVENDPSIKDTPKRFAKMFIGELTKGLNYDFFPKCTSTPNGNVLVHTIPAAKSMISPGETKDVEIKRTVGAYDEAVIVKNIRTTSLCEHHLQTIDGFTHIAYLPRTQVIGLSKLARVAEFFAARPQIQERMTEQIYHALALILETPDVAVVIDAVHFCMRARGVKQPESWTQTNKCGGKFLTKPELRQEFFDAIKS
jgi:GTP cyclohydrolase I